MHIDTARIGLAFDRHKAIPHAWFLAEQLDLFGQHRVPTGKLSLRDAVDVRDSFEPFDPANDLSGCDRRANFHLKLMLDDFPQHARGEPCKPTRQTPASCSAIQKCEGL